MMSWLSVVFALEQISVKSLPHTTANGGEIKTILTIILTILGALGLLFVTIGGFRYVLSGGDPEAAARAKGTIIYALVGVAVVILAQVIVQWVIGNV